MGALQTVLETFGGSMPSLPIPPVAGVAVGFVLAALMCFLGYRLLRVFVAIGGLGIGAVLGILLGGKIADSQVVTLILVIVFAVGICLISFLVYKAGIFILVFFTVFSLLAVILKDMTMPLDYRLIALIAAVVVGILSVIIVRPLTIVVTALGGGMSLAANIGSLIADKVTIPSVLTIVLGVVLAVCGMLVQFKTTSGKGKKRR